VLQAIGAGELDPERLVWLRRLERDVAFLERRGDSRAQSEERRRWRAVSREYRRHEKERRRGRR
jgi:ribosome biogenesis GTPase